jgi:hypothetical protein
MCLASLLVSPNPDDPLVCVVHSLVPRKKNQPIFFRDQKWLANTKQTMLSIVALQENGQANTPCDPAREHSKTFHQKKCGSSCVLEKKFTTIT